MAAEQPLSTIDHAFSRLQAQALASWQTARRANVPYVLVGTATCGRASGALEVVRAFQEELRRTACPATLVPVGCMGHCYAEPLVAIGKPGGLPPLLYGNVTPAEVATLVKHVLLGEEFLPELLLCALEENDLLPSTADLPRFAREKRVVLRDFGLIDPEDIFQYFARGGYRGLARALQMHPDEVIDQVERSGLRGLGGAGFPTGRKWRICRENAGPQKYVVCNADEGDPGSFSDRAVLESSPHQVLEGLIIAAYAIGASRGYLYVRAEYPLAVARLTTALQQAQAAGVLGEKILESGFSLELSLFHGSGAFVCGEETALISSLEGRRGTPRHRPPYPAYCGFKAAPTLIDNVKTLANIPVILTQGAEAFASVGTATSKGTAVFAVAGKINNTGLVEVAMGTTLQDLVFGICGGIPKGKGFKAIQIGGPSGGCLPRQFLDTPIDFDSLRDAGAMMGSGGIVVLDEDDCMVEVARYFLDFLQQESCGKCTFCRIGTKQMQGILENFTKGSGTLEDIELLLALAEDLAQGSLCGLGKTAANPVLTTLRYFREEFEAHITDRCCPAKMCRSLISFYIVPERCERSCDACVGSCPTEAIYTTQHHLKAIDQEKCVKCAACMDACPPQYQAVEKFSPAASVPPAPPRLEKKP